MAFGPNAHATANAMGNHPDPRRIGEQLPSTRPGTGRKGGPDLPAYLGLPPTLNQSRHPWYDGGPQLPQANYTSQINTKAPISGSRAQTLSDVKSPFSYGGTSSGGRSRSALASALIDPARMQLGRQLDQFNTQYQQQAQQSLAQDILSQRQSVMDRNRMEVMKDIFDTDTWTRKQQGEADLTAHYHRERRNAEAQAIAGIFGGLGMGILGALI
jgi:hypothetical protein